ncbi:MAG: YIP1 family protein [Defluviitaleaceae bacterium]|nr:YIP1 family protein [Defluviitaleaceae bacterium]
MIKKIFKFYALNMRLLYRPIDGFHRMKFEKEGTLRMAFLNFLLVCVSYAFFNQFTSILVNQDHPHWSNSLWDTITIFAVLVLFCISNWAVTSLTDGEGKFKEIFMTVCYAMTPLVLILIPATLFSNVITMQETGFFNLLVGIGIGWFVLLVFIGLIVIHNYGVFKAVATVIFTFVALMIILFLITLFFSLIQQLYVFINSIYREVTFRM